MKDKTTEGFSSLSPLQRQSLIDTLFAEECSCVIRHNDTVEIFRRRGIADLLSLFKSNRAFLHGAYVADKVVGKGAAALMILGGVKWVFADVISAPARQLLEQARIEVEYTVEVPHIVNRAGNDWCPVERLCRQCTTAEQCLPLIICFVEEQKQL